MIQWQSIAQLKQYTQLVTTTFDVLNSWSAVKTFDGEVVQVKYAKMNTLLLFFPFAFFT